MKNILGLVGLVIVAAAVGAATALQPWAEQPVPPPTVTQPITVVETAPVIPVSDPAPTVVEEENIETESTDLNSQRLSLAVDILKNLNTKMSALEERISIVEQDLEGARLSQQQTEQHQEELSQPDPDSVEAQAEQLARKAEEQAYFVNLESSILTNYDEGLTQEVTTTFTEFLSSGEAWTEGVTMTATECGGEYCKIAIQYPGDMDATAQFELDGRLYLEAGKQFGQSLTKERRLANGDREIIVYFANGDTRLPQRP